MKLDKENKYSAKIALNSSPDKTVGLLIGFKLSSDNSLSTMKENFRFTILQSLTPKPIEKFENLDDLMTSHSATLQFEMPPELVNISKELMFEVLVRSKFPPEELVKLSTPNITFDDENPRRGMLTLDNLKYANCQYDIKIRLKSRSSDNNENRWSEYQLVTIKTKSKAPEKTPNICENCFNVMDNGNMMLYWTDVPRQFQNGENFTFYIKCWDGDNLIFHKATTKTQLLISKEFSTKNIKVEIFSLNEKGMSRNFTEFFLPSTMKRSKVSINLYKQLINKIYEISWKYLGDEQKVQSYTILHCYQRNDLPNNCEKDFEFVNVPSNVTSYSFTSNKSMQFGIAANFKENKSGFIWAQCTTARSNGKVIFL